MADQGGVDGVEGYEDSGTGGEEGRVAWVISLSVLKFFRPEVLQVGHDHREGGSRTAPTRGVIIRDTM